MCRILIFVGGSMVFPKRAVESMKRSNAFDTEVVSSFGRPTSSVYLE